MKMMRKLQNLLPTLTALPSWDTHHTHIYIYTHTHSTHTTHTPPHAAHTTHHTQTHFRATLLIYGSDLLRSLRCLWTWVRTKHRFTTLSMAVTIRLDCPSMSRTRWWLKIPPVSSKYWRCGFFALSLCSSYDFCYLTVVVLWQGACSRKLATSRDCHQQVGRKRNEILGLRQLIVSLQMFISYLLLWIVL